ncbi:MAG TPA: globin domain-containing protein [Gemmatimonadaceae bacterium]|jgi:hemoglobin-like flavoprotein|nr:globin domain-containing protein [Gemmatimonadaceae bacterium]
MTPERRHLVTKTWRRLAEQGPEFGVTFYRRLFEIDPDLRRLFASTVSDDQARKLTSMLELTVHWLDAPERLVPALKQLGERHAAYGVVDEHYTDFGSALIGTLEERLGDDFTPEARCAWTEAYALISALMRRGAMKASGEWVLRR